MKNILLFLFFCFASLTWAQQNKRDSLENLLQKTGQDTSRVILLNDIAYFYWSTNPEKVKQYTAEAMQLAQKLEFPLGMGRSYVSLSIYYWSQGNYKKAIEEAEKALPHLEQGNHQKNIAAAYHNIGMNYYQLGNFQQATSYYFKALRIYEKLNSTGREIANTYNIIGVVFEHQQKYDQALQYYQTAYQKSKGIDPLGQAGYLLNIGTIYQLKNNYTKAITYLNHAHAQFLAQNEPLGVAMSANHLGEVHLKMRQYDRAKGYFQKGLQLGEENNYVSSILSSLLGLGQYWQEAGQTTQSIASFERAMKIADQTHQNEQRLIAYKGLSNAYAKNGNYPKAYTYQSKWVMLNDSVFNQESAKKIAQVQAEYQAEKKQAEIDLLKKDQEVSRLWRNTIGIGLLATLIIGALIVSRQRLKIRKNQVLLEQSKVVTEKNQQLETQTLLLQKQADTLATQANQLQELDEVKSRFFANISHEFRTPLTLIIGILTEKVRLATHNSPLTFLWNDVAIMNRNAHRLLQLINQLLDLSKIESGKMKVELSVGDLKFLLSTASASFSSMAAQRKIQYTISLSSNPLPVRYNSDQLEKALVNLLSNAFKFTPDGGHITLTANQIHHNDREWIAISVEDSGIGIAPEQVDRVFERFYQGTTSLIGDHPGTGIGLSLVKEIVELHGGSIKAENKPEAGTRFILQLPAVDLHELQNTSFDFQPSFLIPQQQDSTLVDDTSLLPKTEDYPLLLIVEDHDDLRLFIRNQLQGSYQILEATNGLEGLSMSQEHIPDLIISDWMMPQMDGVELCKLIKTNEQTSHIPFILLTALASQDNKLTGLEIGADDYLTKPFDSRELHLRIANLVESRRKLRERFSRELHIKPSDIVVTSADEKFIQRAMQVVEENMGDGNFNAEQFCKEIGLSRMQLHRKLTALTGQSTGDFIRVMRLKRAAQLLEAKAGNVSEVAYEVGFNSLSYFAKTFREQFGILPNEYASQSNS